MDRLAQGGERKEREIFRESLISMQKVNEPPPPPMPIAPPAKQPSVCYLFTHSLFLNTSHVSQNEVDQEISQLKSKIENMEKKGSIESRHLTISTVGVCDLNYFFFLLLIFSTANFTRRAIVTVEKMWASSETLVCSTFIVTLLFLNANDF